MRHIVREEMEKQASLFFGFTSIMDNRAIMAYVNVKYSLKAVSMNGKNAIQKMRKDDKCPLFKTFN